MKLKLRKTKIVGTIGPASESEEVLKELVKSGLNVARINFSHGGFEENKGKIEAVKKIRKELKTPIALILDTKGPEIRTGLINGNERNKISIKEGQIFTFTNKDIDGNEDRVSISYESLYKDIGVGTKILVDDGEVEFKVTKIENGDIICKALNNGELGSRKTINVPNIKLDLPALTQKDRDDITSGVKAGFDFIAASFVRKADDVKQIRELLDSVEGNKVKIISKIENQEGVDNFEEILAISDGIMVARGDLGVEIPMERVPILQKKFIKRCNEEGKPVITATQMLESMIENPRPTRAEVSDVANAVYDITSAIMLSGECAKGKYPVECVKTMNKISKTIENSIKYWKRFNTKSIITDPGDLEGNIAYTACITANHLNANAIVAYTHKGDSIRKISGFGSGCPIYAVADDEKTYYQLALAWNVRPILVTGDMTIEEKIKEGIKILKEQKVLEKGDLVVLAGGSKILPISGENKVIGGFVRV